MLNFGFSWSNQEEAQPSPIQVEFPDNQRNFTSKLARSSIIEYINCGPRGPENTRNHVHLLCVEQ
jgi:hypothetical protein